MSSRTYIMFMFEWSKDYQAYEYCFNCQTGQLEDDHGLLDGDEKDFRYVIALNGLTRLSDIEWDAMGNDIFTPDDLKAIGKVLATQAGFNIKNILRKPPAEGEAVFVWEWYGGMTESSANGPAEGWTETAYLGELSELKITKPSYESEDTVLGIEEPKPIQIIPNPKNKSVWYKLFFKNKTDE
jgi:hypothetical protein